MYENVKKNGYRQFDSGTLRALGNITIDNLTVVFRSSLLYKHQTVDKDVHDKVQPVYCGLLAL